MQPVRSFQIVCALIAVHVVVADGVTLEPGTTLGDRWLGLLVPLSVLALVCIAYPRVKPGLAAAVALSLAALALVGSALAIIALDVEGFDASTVTGAAMLVGALLLAWLGFSGLWRSRKGGGHPLVRRALLGLASAVLAFEVLLPIGFALVATHRAASAPDGDAIEQPFKEKTITTADGLELGAWYVPSCNGASVIVYPDRAESSPYVNMLASNGFGVLALDMRGYGSSEGNPNAYGWNAAADIHAAVRFLQEQPDVVDGKVGGIGLSVGGEQLIEAAALNPGLRAVVSEGAGERSVRETLLFGPRAALAVPQQTVLTAAVALFSSDSPPVALDEASGAIAPRSVFFIYGEDGQASEELNDDFYEAADDPKQLWEVPDAGHVGGLRAEPAEYERRVVSFLERALDADRRRATDRSACVSP